MQSKRYLWQLIANAKELDCIRLLENDGVQVPPDVKEAFVSHEKMSNELQKKGEQFKGDWGGYVDFLATKTGALLGIIDKNYNA